MFDPSDSHFTDVLAGALAQTPSFIETSEFIAEARTLGLWQTDIVMDPAMTVFVPMDYKTGDAGDAFEELWNRHVVRGINKINTDTVQHYSTEAGLVFALCPVASCSLAALSSAKCSFGGRPLGTVNYTHNGSIYHLAETSLPDLRPLDGETFSLRTCYLAGEVMKLTFRGCRLKAGLENSMTLVVSTTKKDRTQIAANQKMGWHGHGTVVPIVMPPVKTRTNVMLWFSLYDNQLRQPIISWALPWFLVVQPNINMHTNLVVNDIIPKVGRPDCELWIRGSGFDERTVRVTVGKNPAQIFHCDSTLIRCFIPPGTGKHVVWVANANVYTRYHDGFVYESPPAPSAPAVAPA